MEDVPQFHESDIAMDQISTSRVQTFRLVSNDHEILSSRVTKSTLVVLAPHLMRIHLERDSPMGHYACLIEIDLARALRLFVENISSIRIAFPLAEQPSQSRSRAANRHESSHRK